MSEQSHAHSRHDAACRQPAVYGHRGKGCLEVDDPEGCAAYDAALGNSGGALLLGERLNVDPEYQRTSWSFGSLATPYGTLTHPGAFLWGVARTRLLRCAVRWSASANLLWPAAKGEWNAAEAKQWAEHLRDDPAFRAHRVVWICGEKPATALGLTHWGPLQIRIPCGGITHQYWVTLPHPSGTSRHWNDKEAPARMREFVMSVYRLVGNLC